MVMPNNDVINYCEECQIEYVTTQGESCPLCPFRIRHEDAVREIRNAEPARIVERATLSDLQASINRLAASGWALADFRVAHDQNLGHGQAVYVAVLQRVGYDPQRHQSAVDAELCSFAAELARQREIEVETENFMDSLSARIWG